MSVASQTVLLLGATGATGRLLLRELLTDCRARVIAPVRDARRIPDDLRKHPGLTLVAGTVLAMPEQRLRTLLQGVDGIACCLGHRLSLRGVYGPPRRLVTDSLRRVCAAASRRPDGAPLRLVLMSSVGVRNHGIDPAVRLIERALQGLIHVLIPPHADNEQAAAWLRRRIGRHHPSIAWCALRPDTLVDDDAVSPVELHPHPQTSALFGNGRTSRINVAATMARLLVEDPQWQTWAFRMPVVYGATETTAHSR